MPEELIKKEMFIKNKNKLVKAITSELNGMLISDAEHVLRTILEVISKKFIDKKYVLGKGISRWQYIDGPNDTELIFDIGCHTIMDAMSAFDEYKRKSEDARQYNEFMKWRSEYRGF